ncbi:hypothetical protein EYF80_039559 [Liparis tanakae]|uniref:Uncharacterized protein n=1 Tax=Liparis tanakae TaxID=230148 RepID=A0A4Z2GC75_9TELE|nr:hypothetical protein EYF80_039559 [Liparis tanakae]
MLRNVPSKSTPNGRVGMKGDAASPRLTKRPQNKHDPVILTGLSLIPFTWSSRPAHLSLITSLVPDSLHLVLTPCSPASDHLGKGTVSMCRSPGPTITGFAAQNPVGRSHLPVHVVPGAPPPSGDGPGLPCVLPLG